MELSTAIFSADAAILVLPIIRRKTHEINENEGDPEQEGGGLAGIIATRTCELSVHSCVDW
jgi:hypothetical protein